MSALLETIGSPSLVVRMPSSVVEMNDDQFFKFCATNRELQIERTAEGDILIMAPEGGESGQNDADIVLQLGAWAKRDGTGVVFGSSTGFTLPNRAVRSPDASWVLKSRLKRLSREERRKFLPLCPDFVIELRSPTDRLSELKDKMAEYIENGAQLGWLIDPESCQVFVYRPRRRVKVLNCPGSVSGDPALPGFVLGLKDIWEPE